MQVTNVNTEKGLRLAVRRGSEWALIDDPDAPTSVDALVRGGAPARERAEQATSHANVPTQASFDRCVPSPGKIIGIGLNYRRHAHEAGLAVPTSPVLFAKFSNALVPSGQAVGLPSTAEQYDYEAELGVVIGRRAVCVSEAEALNYVWGYCNCNDISARELQARSTQYTLGKILDGFLPVGPMLVSSDEVGDPQSLRIQGWLNGELRQDSSTADMVFSVAELVSYISRYVPLEPGDLLATGTPDGVILGRDPKVWMKAGDIAEVQVQGLGLLATSFIEADW